MIHVFLTVMIFVGINVFARGDFAGAAFEGHAVPRLVQIYPALSPDAVDKIYDPKQEVHRLSIVTKKDMPRCLKDVEGPLPFYGHSADARLGSLRADYFASLHFDEPYVQKETEKIRLEAIKIKEGNPERALELLYNSGWKMGDPLSIKTFVDLLVELRDKGVGLISEDSNLIAVLGGCPKTVRAMIGTIISSRGSIDYNRRRSSSESIRADSDDDSSEFEEAYSFKGEEVSLLGPDKQSQLRWRGK